MLIVTLAKEERPLWFFGIIGVVLAMLSIGLAIPLFIAYFETGLVLRQPTAILTTGLMLLAWLSFVCGLILDTVTRGRWELKRLQYLALSPPGPAVETTQRFARVWNTQFLRFAVIGTAAFVVDTAVLYCALWAGLGLYSGRAVSYLVAATFTWYGNRRITFCEPRAGDVGGDRRVDSFLADESRRGRSELCRICRAGQSARIRARISGDWRCSRRDRRTQRELHAQQVAGVSCAARTLLTDGARMPAG